MASAASSTELKPLCFMCYRRNDWEFSELNCGDKYHDVCIKLQLARGEWTCRLDGKRITSINGMPCEGTAPPVVKAKSTDDSYDPTDPLQQLINKVCAAVSYKPDYTVTPDDDIYD